MTSADLPEPLCSVHARAVDENWVEEDGVSSLHLKVDTGMAGVIVLYAMVHLIHTTLWTNARTNVQ